MNIPMGCFLESWRRGVGNIVLEWCNWGLLIVLPVWMCLRLYVQCISRMYVGKAGQSANNYK